MKEMKVQVKVGRYLYTFEKDKDELDELVLKFTEILNELGMKYAVVSGYIAILFGRSRLSEDIDILVEDFDYMYFLRLWKMLDRYFWCIITSNSEDAYTRYLSKGFALRFALKDKVIPNIEIKFPKSKIEKWVIDTALPVTIDSQILRISNIEMQIAFKLYLGSEKDIEDAKHLYELFKESLNMEEFDNLIKMLKVENPARRYLGWSSQK